MTWVQSRAKELSSLANEVHTLVDRLAADDAAKLAKINALTAERDSLRQQRDELAEHCRAALAHFEGRSQVNGDDLIPGLRAALAKAGGK